MGFDVFWDYTMPKILNLIYSKSPLFGVGKYNKEETMQEKRLNEAFAMMDVMAERLRFSMRFLIRLSEDVEGQRALNEALMDEYDRLTTKWADQDDETKEL